MRAHMVVGIDGRGLAGAQRGVARYASELRVALAAVAPDLELRVLEPGARATALAMGLAGRPRADRLLGGIDVLWAPAPRPLALSARCPLVLTVHDRTWERDPSAFTPYERLWHRVARPRALARRAARVVFDTAVVRDDVVRAWSLDPGCARVVVPGVAPVEPGALPPGVAAPFFLFVGALEPRKAPDVALAAHAAARARGAAAALVVVGDGRLASGLALEAPGVVHLWRVPDDALAALYAGALAVVAPSQAEGFGLVGREAIAHGTPAITTDLPVLAEVLGGGALRVGVGDVDALAAALLRVEREPQLRAALVAAAPATRAWADAAGELAGVLREAAGGRRRPPARAADDVSFAAHRPGKPTS